MEDDFYSPPLFGQSEVETDPFEGAPPEGGAPEGPHCRVINYYFPVEVVMTGGGLPERERELLQADVWQELHDAVYRRLA